MATDITRRMLGIKTRYRGPTDYHGSKITVSWADSRHGAPASERTKMYIEWDDALDSGDNHFTAAQTLLTQSSRENWQIIGRTDDDERGYFFVLDYVPA